MSRYYALLGINKSAALVATHADGEDRSDFEHGVSVGVQGDVEKLGSGGQSVADLLHDEVGKLLHPTRCASHTDKLSAARAVRHQTQTN